MSVVLIIPVYNPPENLINLVDELSGFEIIMVNDGCSHEYSNIFDRAANAKNITKLIYEQNQGKGAALKTAFSYVLEHRKDIDYVITLDADGQHAPKDIKNIAEICSAKSSDKAPLIMGSCVFGEGTPSRSLIGNRLTAAIFFLMTGKYMEDTQTGLRAIPVRILKELCEIKANRYEYEMDMLLTLVRKKFPVEKVPISTIYIENNKSSHFNPLRDSIRIYFAILRFGLSSLATTLVDFLIFSLLIKLSIPLLAANLGSRIGALPVYYWLNRDFVFKSSEKGIFVILKFLSVVIISGTVSSALQAQLSQYLQTSEISTKFIIETILFFVNFLVLKKFVFQKKD